MNKINNENRVTEAPSNFSNLENMSVNELLSGINQEDAQVHLAVSGSGNRHCRIFVSEVESPWLLAFGCAAAEPEGSGQEHDGYGQTGQHLQ